MTLYCKFLEVVEIVVVGHRLGIVVLFFLFRAVLSYCDVIVSFQKLFVIAMVLLMYLSCYVYAHAYPFLASFSKDSDDFVLIYFTCTKGFTLLYSVDTLALLTHCCCFSARRVELL